MIYCGVSISMHWIEITALSGSYAFLDSQRFRHDDFTGIHQWINSLKILKNEKSIYCLIDGALECHEMKISDLKFIEYPDEIYFISQNRIIDLMMFFFDWLYETNSFLLFNMDQTYILASSFRLFVPNEIKSMVSGIF